MKRLFLFFAIIGLVLLMTSSAEALVRVRGYFRKDGTYVAPHYRSNPDGSIYNNLGYSGWDISTPVSALAYLDFLCAKNHGKGYIYSPKFSSCQICKPGYALLADHSGCYLKK